MRKFNIVIEVSEETIRSEYDSNYREEHETSPEQEPTIEECISGEFNWLGQSGIYLVEIKDEII